jgi:hypothetical protein
MNTDHDNRALDAILDRVPELAIRELIDCTICANAATQALAEMFPGATGIMGFACCQPCGAVVFARSAVANHFRPSAMAAAQCLAKIVAGLPDKLAEVFLIELKLARELRQLQAEKEKALAAAAVDTRPK